MQQSQIANWKSQIHSPLHPLIPPSPQPRADVAQVQPQVVQLLVVRERHASAEHFLLQLRQLMAALLYLGGGGFFAQPLVDSPHTAIPPGQKVADSIHSDGA